MSMTFAEQDLLAPLAAAPRLDHLAEVKQRLDEAAQDYTREVQEEVRTFLGSAQSFDEGCRFILREASNGKAAEMQGAREPFLNAFQGRLKRLHQASELARHASRMAGRELPEVALLDAEIEGLGRRFLSLATRWHTLEDLAGLTEEGIRRRSSPLDLRRLTLEQRQEVMRRSAELADEDYRTNRELLGFEAFGESDLYDTYPDAEPG